NPPEEHFAQFTAEVQDLIWAEAERTVAAGQDVIFDFGFWTRESRDEARRRVLLIGASPTWYSVECPHETMRARALERSRSPKTDSMWINGPGFDKLMRSFEPMQDDEDYEPIDGTK
ncbi:MAG: AAA family ATPase, partial [Pseudomonadota bacterium]